MFLGPYFYKVFNRKPTSICFAMSEYSETYQNKKSEGRSAFAALIENLTSILELSKSLLLVTKKLLMF